METITAQLNIDTAKAEKKLEELRDKIARMERELNQRNDNAFGLEQTFEKAKIKFEEAQKTLREMEEANERMKAMGEAPAYTYLQIRDQRTEVTKLRKEYESAGKAMEENNKKADELESKIASARESAGRYAQQIKAANDPQAKLNKKMKEMGDNVESISKRIKGLFKRVLIFSVIAKGIREIKDYIVDVAKVTPETREAIGRLKGALLTLAQPIVEVIIPALTKLINILTVVINAISAFVANLTGKSTKQMSENAQALKEETDAMNGVASATKKANKQLAGFDELNILSETSSSSSSSTIDPIFSEGSTEIGTFEHLLELALLIGSALASWKLGESLGLGLTKTIGLFLTLVGVIELALGFVDAWKNGIDFDNLGQMLTGVIALATGLFALFGKLGGAIGLIVGGIAMLVLGFKEWITTGELSEESMTAIVLGLLAIGSAIGVLVGGTGGLIAMLVAALAALVVVVIKDWDKIKAKCQSAIDWIKNAFNKLKEWITNLWQSIVDGIVNAWNKIKNLFNGSKSSTNVTISSIPGLASGSVVPPNKEFLAMLGDNKKETEVVSPLSTMKQAFLEAMQESGGSSSKPVNIYLDGKLLASTTTKYQTQYARAKG